jgi:two-component sensor histidine kinase
MTLGNTAAFQAALARHGVIGTEIADHHWETTYLGAIEYWSASLKATVLMMLGQGQAMCICYGSDLIMLHNQRYQDLLEGDVGIYIGKPFSSLWGSMWPEVQSLLLHVQSGEASFGDDLRFTGDQTALWRDRPVSSFSPFYDDGANIIGIVDVAASSPPILTRQRAFADGFAEAQRSLAQLEVSALQQSMLQKELLHRVKNNLAVTTSVVKQSIHHARSLDEARDSITRRITALGRAQDLLSGDGDSEDIANIVYDALQSPLVDRDRIFAHGRRITLSAQQGMGLFLAVHELASNALKYGALANDKGRVIIAWDRVGDDGIKFHWHEEGGPEVQVPARRGFGSRLTDSVVPAYFSGEGSTIYDRMGLNYQLTGLIQSQTDQAVRAG